MSWSTRLRRFQCLLLRCVSIVVDDTGRGICARCGKKSCPNGCTVKIKPTREHRGGWESSGYYISRCSHCNKQWTKEQEKARLAYVEQVLGRELHFFEIICHEHLEEDY